MAATADRNLLFGILALQMDLISRDALIEAMHAWVLDKDKPLSQILRERGALADEDGELMEAIVRRHLRTHEDALEQSLAVAMAAAPEAVRHKLVQLDDPEIHATLDHVSTGRHRTQQNPDPDATTTWGLGTPGLRGSRFHVLRPHARGGLGVISVALDAVLHREVALKEIQPQRADDHESRARFLLEAEVTGRLEDPGIVPVYSLGQDDRGRPYYAMRLIKGDSLKEAIERFHEADGRPPRSPKERTLAFRSLLDRFLSVCDAVAYAHSRGVLHRDIKPANILLGPYGETLLVDWGLAKAVARTEPAAFPAGSPREATLQPVSGSQSAETVAGTAIGTPAYMSPEQAEGRLNELGPPSDVYSLGATLYCLLTGRPPLEDRDVAEVLRQAARGAFPPPRQVSRSVPLALEAVCLRAMALRASDRYASARALAEDIEHWLADEPLSVYREPVSTRATRWGRRHRTLATAIGVLLVTAVAGLTASTILISREQGKTELQRRAAEQQRGLALAKSVEATQKAELLERQLYINRVNLAYRECLANNLALAERLLEECPPPRRGWEWYYCRRLCHLESRTYSGVTGEDSGDGTQFSQEPSLAFSPDGRRIAWASGAASIRLWDSANGRALRPVRSQGGPVSCVAFSSDGRRMAAGGLGTITLFDAETREPLRIIRGHKGVVTAVAFSPDGRRIASAMSAGIEERVPPETKVWDAETGRELGVFHDARWGTVKLAFSPDGRRIAFVNDWIRAVRLLDGMTAHELETFGGQVGQGCRDVAFSPDGRQVASANRDGTLTLWDGTTGTILRTFRGHASHAQSIAFSPDGSQIASSSADGTIRLWESQTGREVASLRGHAGAVCCVRFDPDGTRLASTGWDRTLKFWEVLSPGDALNLEGYRGWAFRALFGPDSRRLVSAGFRIIQVHDAATGERSRAISPFPGGGVQGLALSPDGRHAAASGEFRTDFDLWDLSDGQRLVTFRGHDGRLRGVAFSPDGQHIASASEDRTIKIWDAAGQEIKTLRGHAAGVFGVAYSPDGQKLASISWDSTVKLWDVATGQEVRTFRGIVQRSSVIFGNAVAFSPDGRSIAAASDDGRVLVWDVETGREALHLTGHSGEVNAVTFSPDGRRIASGAADNTIKLWDAQTGEDIFTLRGHGSTVLGVAFSPDGNRIASASADLTVKIWDALPPAPDTLHKRRALVLVARLFQELLLKDDVVARLRGDAALSEPIRAAALALGASWHQDPQRLNNASWAIVKSSGRSREDYLRALRYIEAACRIEPESGTFLNTLGVAQYRAGRDEAAMATLTRSDRVNAAAFQGSIPQDLAFLAMAHYRLGHRDLALAALTRLHDAMKKPRWSTDSEGQSFLRDADALIGTRPGRDGKSAFGRSSSSSP
jgi:WD40 repeat protein/serine/threonine protein kinase